MEVTACAFRLLAMRIRPWLCTLMCVKYVIKIVKFLLKTSRVLDYVRL